MLDFAQMLLNQPCNKPLKLYFSGYCESTKYYKLLGCHPESPAAW